MGKKSLSCHILEKGKDTHLIAINGNIKEKNDTSIFHVKKYISRSHFVQQ